MTKNKPHRIAFPTEAIVEGSRPYSGWVIYSERFHKEMFETVTEELASGWLIATVEERLETTLIETKKENEK